MPKHSRRFGFFSHVGPIDDASRFSAVRDSRSTRNASPRAVVTSPPRGRSRWGAGTRRPRAASRRARRAPPLPARPPLPPRPPPRRLPRRFAPPAPRRRGFALEFSAPSHHRSASSDLPTPRVRSRARPGRARPRRSRPRSRARTIATAPSRARRRTSEHARGAPRRARGGALAVVPRRRRRRVRARGPQPPTPQSRPAILRRGRRTTRDHRRASSAHPRALPSPLRRPSRPAPRPRGAPRRGMPRARGAPPRRRDAGRGGKRIYNRARPAVARRRRVSPRLALAQRYLASIETRARNPTRS